MSFSVKFYNNTSDKAVVSKSLAEIGSFNCILKNGTNILNPTFIIKMGAFSPKDVNYAIVEDFGRQYFITNINLSSGGMWELSGKVDVLSTYFPQIAENEAIINRQASQWNLFLNDNSFTCYQNPHIVQKEFPSGFSTDAYGFSLVVAGQPPAE